MVDRGKGDVGNTCLGSRIHCLRNKKRRHFSITADDNPELRVLAWFGSRNLVTVCLGGLEGFHEIRSLGVDAILKIKKHSC